MDLWHAVLALLAVGFGVLSGVLAAGFARARRAAEADRAAHDAELARTAAALGEARDRAERERAERDESSGRVVALSSERARLAAELEAAGREVERLRAEATQRDARWKQEWQQIEQQFREAFGALSSQTLRAQTEQFFELAKAKLSEQRALTAEELEKRKAAVEAMVKPLAETLEQTRQKVEAFDRARAAGQATLAEQLAQVLGTSAELRAETARLSRALARPEVRGRYGEIQLRRVAELAGMRPYCDFAEQSSARDDEGNALRPDMVVRLPNDRVVVVDAKANIQAYLDAASTTDEAQREEHLDRFARHIAEQAKKLSDKRYWASFERSPDFVVMFVPGDQFVDAALARRPELLEFAAERHVLLASPSTLIGLLRAVAVGWREHSVSEQARELIKLGVELHQRAAKIFEHTDRLGRSLSQAVNGYNDLIGSMDRKLTPTLRRFEELGAKSAKELVELKPVDTEPRAMLTDGL